MGKQSGEKLYDVKLQGLVAFSEVKVCLTAKLLIGVAIYFFGEGKGLESSFEIFVFLFVCCLFYPPGY